MSPAYWWMVRIYTADQWVISNSWMLIYHAGEFRKLSVAVRPQNELQVQSRQQILGRQWIRVSGTQTPKIEETAVSSVSNSDASVYDSKGIGEHLSSQDTEGDLSQVSFRHTTIMSHSSHHVILERTNHSNEVWSTEPSLARMDNKPVD